MRYFTASFLAVSIFLLSTSVHAGDSNVDLWTGEGVSIGGVLFPHFHAIGLVGASTADDISDLANGHHDPQRSGTLQALEAGLSLRLNDYVHGFAVYSIWTDEAGDLDGEMEEAFLKLRNLPGGLELRGGRFFNRFGFQSALHNHAWDFVNQTLLNGRLLQEGELITNGGEITWNLPSRFPAVLSYSLGEALKHEEHHHDEGADYDEAGARFESLFHSANLMLQMDYNDFHQHRGTLSAAWGGNEFDRTTVLLGIGYEYLWRANGYEPGGAYFRLRNEIVHRRFGAVSGGDEHGHDEDDDHDEHGHHDHDEDDEKRIVRARLHDTGFYSSALYGWNDHVETGVRVGYVTALDETGSDERWRVSPVATFSLNAQRTVYTRVQYDFDYRSSEANDHSLWLQVGFNWGGPEVR